MVDFDETGCSYSIPGLIEFIRQTCLVVWSWIMVDRGVVGRKTKISFFMYYFDLQKLEDDADSHPNIKTGCRIKERLVPTGDAIFYYGIIYWFHRCHYCFFAINNPVGSLYKKGAKI